MKTVCEICPRRCSLSEGQTGSCRARANEGGRIVSINYGRITSLSLDPIEKKPLARFYPGSMILSVGSFGCNMACLFCQNSGISMAVEGDIDSVYMSPRELADKAQSLVPRGNIGLAYTYNEPLVGFEFVRDCSILIRQLGLKNVAVTNGMINEGPLRELLPLLDAMNIDLKAFTPEFYKKMGGDLDAVRRNISLAASRLHVEVTTLIIPGENDGKEEMEELSAWLSTLSPEIPLHISRFFPCYKMKDRPPTPVSVVYSLAETARKYLRYVYTGNC
jgi:pyruvate formate lyase activating enzyme